MLVALLSGQRCQTIYALTISGMKLTTDNVIFVINKLLKTSKPGKHYGSLQFKTFTLDKDLCVKTCIEEYVKRTEPQRSNFDSL